MAWNTDPFGMLISLLVLQALMFGRKKNRKKLDHFVVLISLSRTVCTPPCSNINNPKAFRCLKEPIFMSKELGEEYFKE